MDPDTASSSAGSRALCVLPNLPDIASVPLPSGLLGCGKCLLLQIPLLAELEVLLNKRPVPPSSISRAPSTSALPRTAPSTSLWIVSSPSSPTALRSGQPGKSGNLGAPGAQSQQVLHGTFMGWIPLPQSRRLKQDQLGTCWAKLRQTVGDVPAFPWVSSFRELPMDSCCLLN